MADVEQGRRQDHDNMAPNCRDPWSRIDPLAHCPKCCVRTDHVLVRKDHQLGSFMVSLWSHRGVRQEEELVFRHMDGTEESIDMLVPNRQYTGTFIRRRRNV